ncbi:GumC family protein [Azotobacter chroococcum]
MDMNAQIPARPWLARSQADDDETDLQQLWRTLWRRKWSILSLVVVAVAVAIFAVLGITPVYRAGATLMIEEKQAKVVSIEQIYGLDGSGSGYLQTQFELLKSRALAERVVRELSLTSHPEFDPRQQPEPLLDIRGLFAVALGKIAPGPQPEDQEESPESAELRIFSEVTRALMARINIEPMGKSQMVRVQVDMADARLAARAANALATGFIESQMEATMKMSATATAWMNSRLGELHNELKEAEERLQAFREKENLVDVGGVATISAAELSATSDRMIDARRQRAEAESLYRQVQASRGAGWEHLASIPAVLGDPLIQQFKANEAQARAKVEELAKRYGPRHPAMEAAQTELAAASASLHGQVEQVVAGIQRNYQIAIANEGSLRASVETNKAQIQNISRKEFRVRELQREVEANRALYETFRTRLKETTATADLETANARVVDMASVPSIPIKPKKSLIVAMAGLLALFAGIGITLLLDALNNTFKSTEDVENKLYMPVLGILPLIRNKQRSQLAHLYGDNEEKPSPKRSAPSAPG